jgi:hypothetical protein
MSEPSEMSDFERALARLTPNAALDRDRVIFQAGARSVRRRRLPVSAAALLVGALGGFWLNAAIRPADTITSVKNERPPEFVPVESAPTPLEPSSYGALQRKLLRGDGDLVALSYPGAPKSPAPRSLAEQRRELLPHE